MICCARTGGWCKHNFLIGGAFRKAKYEIRRRKNRNRKARAGKNSFPSTPFLFARPSVRFSAPPLAEQSVGVSFKKGSSFVQQLRPNPKSACRRILGLVGVPGIEPGSYPPHGQILPLYYTPNYRIIGLTASD